jgi:hypothetical protein
LVKINILLFSHCSLSFSSSYLVCFFLSRTVVTCATFYSHLYCSSTMLLELELGFVKTILYSHSPRFTLPKQHLRFTTTIPLIYNIFIQLHPCLVLQFSFISPWEVKLGSLVTALLFSMNFTLKEAGNTS